MAVLNHYFLRSVSFQGAGSVVGDVCRILFIHLTLAFFNFQIQNVWTLSWNRSTAWRYFQFAVWVFNNLYLLLAEPKLLSIGGIFAIYRRSLPFWRFLWFAHGRLIQLQDSISLRNNIRGIFFHWTNLVYLFIDSFLT